MKYSKIPIGLIAVAVSGAIALANSANAQMRAMGLDIIEVNGQQNEKNTV